MYHTVESSIRRAYSDMFNAERKVADYILENKERIVEMHIAELANLSGTSEATIIRMCKRVGYSGFYQLKINLAKEMSVDNLDSSIARNKPIDVVSFFESVSSNILEISKNIEMKTMMECVEAIAAANTVYTIAWGNTCAIASDLAHRLNWLGIKSFTSDVYEYMVRSISIASKEDLLIAVSHSGSSIQVIQVMELAKQRGLKVILITDSINSKASEIANLTLSTKSKKNVFKDIGGVSHIYELITVDALLYFLLEKKKILGKINMDDSELILSQYKL